MGRPGPDAGALAVLALVPFVLYRGVLGLWWSHDDFFLLRFVSEHRVWEYAFQRDAWRSLPGGVFMPLLLFSYDLDRALFGPAARAFYLHQLLAADLGFLALYALLRQWLPVGWAAFGTGLALLGTPVALSLQLLMSRHYLEGLAPAALAVLLFVRARAGGRFSSAEAAGSAALYLLASLAKEIFVPLPALLFCLAPGGARERCRRLAPHLVALALYLACRVSLLEKPFTVYGWAVEARDLPRLALALPGKAGRLILGGPSPAGLLLALGLGMSLAALAVRLGRRGIGFLLVGAGIALLPILPVSTELEPRFAFACWLLAAVAATFGCQALGQAPGRRRFALGLAAGLGLSALVVNRQSWAASLPLAERAGTEARSLVLLPAGAYLRQPLGPPQALHQLAWFRQGFLHLPAGAAGGWFFDDLFLCRLPPAARIFQYSAPARAVTEVTAAARAAGDAHCASIRPGAPLAVALRYTRSSLRWQLGPYERGRYWFVFADGVDALEVPPAGGYRRPERSGFTLRVRYQSPEGWNTYSPELALDLVEGRHLELRRDGTPVAAAARPVPGVR